MLRNRFAPLSAAIALFGMAGMAHAQTVVVTPSNMQGWQTAVFGAGAVAGITADFPRSGNGSAFLSQTDNVSSESDIFIDFANTSSLSSLSTLGYDWYRSSASTLADGGIIAPAFALHMDDGIYDDYLVYEPYYNTALPAIAPTDTWVTSSIAGGLFWRSTDDPSATGTCASTLAYITLADFNANCYGGNAQVRGLDLFAGESYPGSFIGAVDNVQLAFGSDPVTTYNFEPDAVSTPEPASIVLLGTGFVGLAGFVRRRARG